VESSLCVLITFYKDSLFCFCRGDVVICRSKNDPKLFICKRVKGLAGDYVSSTTVTEWPRRIARTSRVRVVYHTL
jgi:hypothetical protein